MLFNSPQFVIFLPVVFILYYALKYKYRRFFLLIASCIFYMVAIPKYIFILFGLITVDYFLGIAIDKEENKKKRLSLLSISIIANVGALLFFKYFNFFNENIATIANLLHLNYAPLILNIIIPLGLSFHIFQSLSYVVEVYKKKYAPEKNYINYALYVMFFPQLVAGPIERPQHLLPQIAQNHDFDALRARHGLERILWGFFKKLVIADQIGQIINPYYAHLPSDGPLIFIVAILFTYQIYCDFSGYSDIALGSAMLFGFNLIENFNRPFSAKSFSDFWNRWHISLSNWLRDYMYYPLVLSAGRVSKLKIYLSTFVTLVVIGLWHGANWTFGVFGAIHGFYLVAETILEKQTNFVKNLFIRLNLSLVYKTIHIIIFFLLITIPLIFFRSKNVHDAWFMLTHVGSNFTSEYITNHLYLKVIQATGKEVVIATLVAIVFLEIVQYIQAKKNTLFILDYLSKKSRYFFYYALMFSIMVFGYLGSTTFIYFQF